MQYPGADYKQNQIGVLHPQLVESTGVDGRFLGAIRPFPGMADSTVHGVPKPEAGQTITSISNIVYAKYVAIQKGATRYTLKGIAYIADNQAATGSAIYFAYRDSEDGSNDVVMLEDFKSWTDFTLDSLAEYDITSNGKYIYFVCSGTTSSTPLTDYNTKEPPYNKAYFYDWKINDWDAFDRNSTGFEGRFMGLMPTRFLLTPINEDPFPSRASGTLGALTESSATFDVSGDTPNLSAVIAGDIIKFSGSGTIGGANTTFTFQRDVVSANDEADTVVMEGTSPYEATNVIWSIHAVATIAESSDSMDLQVHGGHDGWFMPKGVYTGAVELVSRKHNLRSYIRYRSKFALGTTNSAFRFFVDEIKIPTTEGSSGQTNQLRGDNIDATCILHWGIPHCDGFRFWRSQGDGSASDLGEDKYTLVNPLYLLDEYIPKETYAPTSALLQLKFDHAPVGSLSSQNGPDTTYYTDDGLITQTPFDALDESFGVMPRAKLLSNYAGLLIGVTDIAEPSTLEDDWDDADRRTEELFFSHTGKLEPENFPPENRYPPDDPGEKFLSLEVAGDHCFAISNASVYKVTRSGSTVAMNRILSRLGGVSRYGATGVGNVLFIVTPSGVKSVDGNTGAIKSISAMDRIIMDDSEWAQSLGTVHLQYDATMGLLVFLNTTKKECFLLWEATGAVTRLVDCPWAFLAGGNDVLTNGAQRAYFILTDGTVHAIDGAREMGKRSMCGTGASETVNGTCTTASATQIIDTAATFPVNCVGHQVYIQNGNMEGDSVEITTRNSATVVTVSGLSEATTTATRYSVAPVVTELVFQQLDAEGNGDTRGVIDPFSRKIVVSMSAAFSDLGGETDTTDTNAFIRFGVWRNRQRLLEVETGINIIPDQCVAKVIAHDVRVYPSLRFLGGNLDFELQAVLIHGILGPSEAQSRQS
ncbi:hypothetical protein LCGC14_0330360 [marine sediment metagenome]|uniref:Uncharacterized protein n=1 Tax=marine sediment metagenome TaxID=412755 RepID=A0A0F9WP25_9ZZZZ